MVADVSLTVRRLFLSMQFSDHGHISRTEQDRLIVTNENYWEVTSLILLLHSAPPQSLERYSGFRSKFIQILVQSAVQLRVRP